MGGRASSEDRTRDLALTKRMLCQLSYRGLFRLGRLDVRRSPPPPGPSSAAPPWQCVHSTRVVFNPSKVKIRVRVPMNARLHSLGAGPLLVAQVAWVRIPVKAFSFLFLFIFFFRRTGHATSGKALVVRSYQGESSASHPNCELKHL